MTTELYQAYTKAEAAWNAAEMDLDLLWAADAAYKAYSAELIAARDEWAALRDSEAKSSATTNAYDTEGTDEDELYWFQIALSTYEECKSYGYAV